MPDIQHFIYNELVTSEKSYIVRSSADQSKLHAVSAANEQVIDQAIAAAQSALPTWRATTIERRQKIFMKAARLLENRMTEFVEMMQKETPCGPNFSDFNANATPAYLRELATSITAASKGEIIRSHDGESCTYVFREPYGVCLAMAPWNAAMLLACRAFASPIIAGNTVVFKTSEYSPGTHALFGQLMKDAGLPSGVLNIIHIDAADAPRLVARLIADKRVRHVNFTGSTRVGSIVGSLAGKYIKPCLLELGGKAPAIVLEDADVNVAASHIILGAWLHQGQICMSTEKAIVMDSIYDSFVAKINELAADSGIRSSPLGLAIEAGAEKAQDLVEDAVSQGATAIMGSHEARKGQYISPCILTDVKPDMRIYNEETFAPVFIILRAKSEDEAVALANDTDYGLSSSIFTKDVARAIDLGLRLEAGATHINSMTVHDHPAVPHGGMKSSGFGRFNGVEGVRSFLQTKVITTHGQGQAIPL